MASYDNKVVTGAGVSALKTWVDNRISNLAGGASAPVGTIMAYAGEGTPFGWLLCDGSAVSRATFADLFSAIGTTYGAGDGSTTFNLPNLFGRFLEGASVAGESKEAGLPNIRGTFGDFRLADTSPTASGAFLLDSGTSRSISSNTSGTVSKDVFSFDASRSDPIYGASDTVQPPAVTVRYIIKAYNEVNPAEPIENLMAQTTTLIERRYIVEASPMPTSLDDNYSWYRLWSDGWLEQGGVRKATTNSQTHSITFLKPYRYNNYSVSVAFEYSNASSAEYKYICPKNLTTTGFQILGYVTNTQYTSWHTEGWTA